MQDRYLVKRNRMLHRKIHELEKMCKFFIILSIIFFGVNIFLAVIIALNADKVKLFPELQTRLAETEEKYKKVDYNTAISYDNLKKEYIKLENNYDKVESSLEDLASIEKDLDDQNKELVDKYNNLNTEYKNLVDESNYRAKLYKDYSWSTTYSGTDITYDDIITLQSIIANNNMGSDMLDLVLAIGMEESRGKQSAYNSSSGASGIGQLLPSTAKYVYENVMGNGSGSFYNSLLFNHTSNLKISLYYLDYLARRNNRNVMAVLNGYAGGYSQDYINKVNSYLSNVEKSIYNITI